MSRLIYWVCDTHLLVHCQSMLNKYLSNTFFANNHFLLLTTLKTRHFCCQTAAAGFQPAPGRPGTHPLDPIPSSSSLFRAIGGVDRQECGFPGLTFDDITRDRLITLEEDKSQYVYQLCRAMNAKTIVEAGASFGVSTTYLTLAVTANAAATGGQAGVIDTENEPTTAEGPGVLARMRSQDQRCDRAW